MRIIIWITKLKRRNHISRWTNGPWTIAKISAIAVLKTRCIGPVAKLSTYLKLLGPLILMFERSAYLFQLLRSGIWTRNDLESSMNPLTLPFSRWNVFHDESSPNCTRISRFTDRFQSCWNVICNFLDLEIIRTELSSPLEDCVYTSRGTAALTYWSINSHDTTDSHWASVYALLVFTTFLSAASPYDGHPGRERERKPVQVVSRVVDVIQISTTQ